MSAKQKFGKVRPETDNFEDRRRHFRADMRLKARFLGPDGVEHPCVVINVSAGGAMVKATTLPRAEDRVILYIDGVGRFESTVVRTGKFGFAVHYNSRRAKTQRTADALIRTLNRRGQLEKDRRIAPRIALDTPVIVTHDDGRSVECTIMDVSLTGASVGIEPQPPLGTELTVGRMRARVVRRHELGIGVIFLGPAERMEDVIEKAAGNTKLLTHDAPGVRRSGQNADGTTIATPFGRKHSDD
ncbi:MAG: PilZ domain-containing protein [Pseudomonadota bacterium]